MLEEELGPDAEAIQVARIHAFLQAIAVLVQVLELDLEVVAQVPVEAHLDGVRLAAIDGAAIQIEVVPPDSHFPRSSTPDEAAVLVAGQEEGAVRTGNVRSAKATQAAVVEPVLAGQEVGGLDVAAVEPDVAEMTPDFGAGAHVGGGGCNRVIRDRPGILG